MLPGFPQAPLWIVITIVVVGAMLFYLGSMSRGRNKGLAMLLGIALIAYAFAPMAGRYLAAHPEIGACVRGMWARQSLYCPDLR